MWRCKECGSEVVAIETINTTTTYELTKNQKRRKIKNKSSYNWEVGYICSNLDCENNEEYNGSLTDIAEWVE